MKNSIKRAQSQACLGFAERKNFRPLAKQLKKLSLTLALLITAAASAWADDTDPEVNITNANTTASFTMPANDVTVNYTLVRDMNDHESENDVHFDGLPTGDGLIVKKVGDNYQFITTPGFQLIDPLISGDNKNIINADGLTVTVEKKNANNNFENSSTLEAFLADAQPGTYKLKAVPKDATSPYEGTVYSSEFTVVEQYDLTVKPADEYSIGKLDKVIVGSGTEATEITPDANTGEATKTGIAPNTEVKLKAKHGYIIEKTLTYPVALSAVTADYLGSVVTTDGNVYPAKTAVPSGCTAVGILGKVTETGHGLILALQDAAQQNWNTINSWTSETTYAGTTLKVLPDDDARGTNLTSYTTLGETAVSNWAVAQKSDYEAIFQNLGSTKNSGGMTYDDNVNAYITTGVGGTALSDNVNYWSATMYDDDEDEAWIFNNYNWIDFPKTNSSSVRPVLGF